MEAYVDLSSDPSCPNCGADVPTEVADSASCLGAPLVCDDCATVFTVERLVVYSCERVKKED